MRTTRVVVALALALIGTEAFSQVDRTGTGGGPLSTQTAPNTTAVGQTKPPSRATSPTSVDNPDRRTADERRMDKIDRSICVGCGGK